MQTCYVDYETRAIADLIPPGELTPGWCVSRINVPAEHRGKGHGTKMLKRIIADADAEGVNLWLDVVPSGAMDHAQLTNWYMRYGFKLNAATGYLLRRPRKGGTR